MEVGTQTNEKSAVCNELDDQAPKMGPQVPEATCAKSMHVLQRVVQLPAWSSTDEAAARVVVAENQSAGGRVCGKFLYSRLVRTTAFQRQF